MIRLLEAALLTGLKIACMGYCTVNFIRAKQEPNRLLKAFSVTIQHDGGVMYFKYPSIKNNLL